MRCETETHGECACARMTYGKYAFLGVSRSSCMLQFNAGDRRCENMLQSPVIKVNAALLSGVGACVTTPLLRRVSKKTIACSAVR